MQLVLGLVVYTPLPLSDSTSHFASQFYFMGVSCGLLLRRRSPCLRVHRKILRTIQGLPLRCHSKALQCLMGVPSVLSLIQQWQLNSLSLLPADSLPHLVLIRHLRAHPQKDSLPVFRSLVDSLDLPSLPAIIN